MTFILDDLPALTPSIFIDVSYDIVKSKGLPKKPYKAPYLLMHQQDLLDEDSFAQVSICYEEEGIYLAVLFDKPFEQALFPNIAQGDGIEIFIDTRDLKSVGSIHKFCHHFLFLPKEDQGIQKKEITRMKLEDAHPLCEDELLHLETLFYRDSFEMKIFIEADALYGYDLTQTSKIGFAYKIHGKGYNTQHLSKSSESFSLEKYPNLWTTLNLN